MQWRFRAGTLAQGGGQEGNTADPEKLLEMMLGQEMLLAVSFWWEK